MNVHDEVTQQMKRMAEAFASAGVNLQMPPPSNEALGTVYVGIEMGQSLTAEIPFAKELTNPIGTFQGGFLCAAFDDVFGPLTYMAAERPVVTVEMSTTYIRPFVESDRIVSIRAEVVAKKNSLIVLKAEAKNPDGKLIATASAHAMIIRNESLSRTDPSQGGP